MKLFAFKYHEILLNEAIINEERFVQHYKNLFDVILGATFISHCRIYECIDFAKGTVSNKPLLTARLLKKDILPPFKFLVCNN